VKIDMYNKILVAFEGSKPSIHALQQDKRKDTELGNEFQVGNTNSQSQKKSGRQINKE
jgi:hypothetical protein